MHWLWPDDPPRGPRQLPMAEVRHLLSHGQTTITLDDPPAADLQITWVRKGGTFGSQSALEANNRQRLPRSSRSPMPTLDRGISEAWQPYWVCRRCSRRARILCNRWADLPPDTASRLWVCQRCCKFRWPSQRLPGTSNGGRPPSWHYATHQHHIDRIRDALETPQRLSGERRDALERLELAHHILAVAALSDALAKTAASARLWVSAPSVPSVDLIAHAHRELQAHKWALRQQSWHRNGKPRPGPAGRERQAAALTLESLPGSEQ